jgi:hypothetical protein
MTGAMLLPSTDNMIKQYGEECLGTCSKFWLRLVQDDPERSNETQPSRILRTRISRASTYAYIEGCPAERGCTIVLRGGNRLLLSEVKRIMRFAILVAYHLRLEVAFYNDRFADLPSECDMEDYDDGSDVDDEVVDGDYETKQSSDSTNGTNNPTLSAFLDHYPEAKYRKSRYFISTSMDIDFNIPYRKELVGTSLFRSKNLTKFTVEAHQSLLITSLLMTETSASSAFSQPIQKSPADVKGIKFYTKHDVSLGNFIIENCFQLSRNSQMGGMIQRETRMLDQTLSFAHKPGRIDISVRKIDKNLPSSSDSNVSNSLEGSLLAAASGNSNHRDPFHLPLYISSYCRECGKIVTPQHSLSEEVWKMSFGKFLEIMFYNRSARCTISGCNHSLRDDHILSFTCENYIAIFEFFPIHPFSLNVREGMNFPEDFYWKQSLALLTSLPEKHSLLMEDFRLAVGVLEREVHDILVSRPEDLALAMADVQLMSSELAIISTKFYEDLLRTYEALPRRYADKEAENRLRSLFNDRLTKISNHRVSSERLPSLSVTGLCSNETVDLSTSSSVTTEERIPSTEENTVTALNARSSVDNSLVEKAPSIVIASNEENIDGLHEKMNSVSGVTGGMMVIPEFYPTEFNASSATIYPMALLRETFLKARRWNTRIDTIYKFLESVRNMLLQQLALKEGQTALDKPTPASIYSTTEDYDGEYQNHKKHLTEVVIADLGGRNPLDLPIPPSIHSASTSSSSALITATVVSPVESEDSVRSTNSATATATASEIPSQMIITSPSTASLAESSLNPVTPSSGAVFPVISQALPVHGAINSLYRAALDQNRGKITDRPVDKMSRITKALSRFLAGKPDSAEEQTKFFVPLGEFGNGRYSLKPGRHGVVIPVTEDVLASIIAYTLASSEYYDDLQASIRDDTIERNYEPMNEADGMTGVNTTMNNEGDDNKHDTDNIAPRGRGKTLQGQQFASSEGSEPSK